MKTFVDKEEDKEKEKGGDKNETLGDLGQHRRWATVAQSPVAQRLCCSTSLLLNVFVAQHLCCTTFLLPNVMCSNVFLGQRLVAESVVAQPLCCRNPQLNPWVCCAFGNVL